MTSVSGWIAEAASGLSVDSAATVAVLTAAVSLVVALFGKSQDRQNAFRQHRAEIYEDFALEAHRVGHEIAEVWRRATLGEQAPLPPGAVVWTTDDEDVFEQLDSVVSNKLRRLQIVASPSVYKEAEELLSKLTLVRNTVHYIDPWRPYDTALRSSFDRGDEKALGWREMPISAIPDENAASTSVPCRPCAHTATTRDHAPVARIVQFPPLANATGSLSWSHDVWKPFTAQREGFGQAARRDVVRSLDIWLPIAAGVALGAAVCSLLWLLLAP